MGKVETFDLSVSEFYDNRDQAGFFPREKEPEKFFSLEEVTEIRDSDKDGAIA